MIIRTKVFVQIGIIIIINNIITTTTTITYSYYLFNILVLCVCVFVPEIFVPEYKLNEIYFTINSIFCSQWPWLNHIFLVVRLIYEQKTRHQIQPKRSLNIYSWAAELAPCHYIWWQYFPYRRFSGTPAMRCALLSNGPDVDPDNNTTHFWS